MTDDLDRLVAELDSEARSDALGAYRQGNVADASRRIAGLGRFRINLHRERGRAAATIRMIPSRVLPSNTNMPTTGV